MRWRRFSVATAIAGRSVTPATIEVSVARQVAGLERDDGGAEGAAISIAVSAAVQSSTYTKSSQ